jgi:hypothetical protein
VAVCYIPVVVTNLCVYHIHQVNDHTLNLIRRENLLWRRRGQDMIDQGSHIRLSNQVVSVSREEKQRREPDLEHHIVPPITFATRKRVRAQAHKLPTGFHSIAWLLYHMHADLQNRSNFLNKMPIRRPTITTLPKPFFSRSLRASAATIGRLIH